MSTLKKKITDSLLEEDEMMEGGEQPVRARNLGYENPEAREELDKRINKIFTIIVAFLCFMMFVTPFFFGCEINYVFELNRHGARAPTTIWHNNDTYGFNLGPHLKDKGMLTPIGMRQRYLLGKYNQHIYNNQTNLNFKKMIGKKTYGLFNRFGIYSTNFYRTIQSSYASNFAYFQKGENSHFIELN